MGSLMKIQPTWKGSKSVDESKEGGKKERKTNKNGAETKIFDFSFCVLDYFKFVWRQQLRFDQ
jgi:hypothetical protein